MSDLANRLVTAAEAKLNELHAADGVVSYPTAARWATVAVLRELERHAREDMDGDLIHALDLDEWAGVIEKGEQE